MDAYACLHARPSGAVWVTNISKEFYDLESDKWDDYDMLLPLYGEMLSGVGESGNMASWAKKIERDRVDGDNYGVLLTLAREGRLEPSAVPRGLVWRGFAEVQGHTHASLRLVGRV